jgi:hypothetical protein
MPIAIASSGADRDEAPRVLPGRGGAPFFGMGEGWGGRRSISDEWAHQSDYLHLQGKALNRMICDTCGQE